MLARLAALRPAIRHLTETDEEILKLIREEWNTFNAYTESFHMDLVNLLEPQLPLWSVCLRAQRSRPALVSFRSTLE